MKIKVMADYGCSPLWWDEPDDPDKVGPIELDELPLTRGLAEGLKAWADEFTATFHDENPVRFEWPTPEAYPAWLERGALLTEDLQNELGASASVRYFHERERVSRRP